MLRHRAILKSTTGKNLARPVIVFCIILAAVWLIYHRTKLNLPELEVLDTTDQLGFYSHWETRLPKYRDLFLDAATQHDVDWPLLVAVGYQESKWRADAVSPTGVRGLMMLTRATAKELGIEDRTKPDQSIYGGAQYLKVSFTAGT